MINETQQRRLEALCADPQARREDLRRCLEHGARINGGSIGGLAPVMRALQARNEAVAHALLDLGADFLHVRHLGKSVLAYASEHGVLGVASRLLACGASIDDDDGHGNSLLHQAVLANNRIAVRFLLEQGLPVDFRPKASSTDQARAVGTPLALALEMRKWSMALLLIGLGADRDLVDEWPLSKMSCWRLHHPLHAACDLGESDLVLLLLEAGFDPDVKDDRDDRARSAWDYARDTDGDPGQLDELLRTFKARSQASEAIRELSGCAHGCANGSASS